MGVGDNLLKVFQPFTNFIGMSGWLSIIHANNTCIINKKTRLKKRLLLTRWVSVYRQSQQSILL